MRIPHFIHDKNANTEKLQSIIEDSKTYTVLGLHNDMIIIKALANENEELVELQKNLAKTPSS